MKSLITQTLLQSARTHERTAELLADDIAAAAGILLGALQAGGKIAFCGNGGSAADAQHLAAELVGRFQRERGAFAGIALTTDTSILTSVGNDYGFEHVFERQVEGLLREGDVLVAISASGNSPNVLLAARKAREIGAQVIGMTGASGGELANAVQLCLRVPSDETSRVQETHIVIGHILCDLVEAALCVPASPLGCRSAPLQGP